MVWYTYFESDNPAGKERYEKQTERVLMVLNNILKGKQYLVADKV
jgi:glutathione S-transferase